MSKKQLHLVFVLFFSFVALCGTPFLSAAQAGPHVVLTPKISFAENNFNFGNVDEGVELRHTFKIENKGEKTLVIKTAFSTCGCTVPHIKNKEIAPGASGDLEVIMDTSMKQGDVTKPIEIHSNDPVTPIATIYVKASVKSPHADLGEDRTAKIFTGRCAACHVDKGKGQLGEELFFADCAMCHGFRAKGIPSVGPSLIPMDYHDKTLADAMKTIISRGSKVHRSMPGYAREAGGPLNEKEIDSIVEYLKVRSDELLKSKD